MRSESQQEADLGLLSCSSVCIWGPTIPRLKSVEVHRFGPGWRGQCLSTLGPRPEGLGQWLSIPGPGLSGSSPAGHPHAAVHDGPGLDTGCPQASEVRTGPVHMSLVGSGFDSGCPQPLSGVDSGCHDVVLGHAV